MSPVDRTDLRNRLWLAAALVLTLAIGIALGAGPLMGHDAETTAAAPSAAEGGGQGDGPDTYAAAFAAAGATKLYAGGLAGHPTAILALPGADRATTSALTGQVQAAGGTVTGTFTLGDELLDPGRTDDVDAATTGLAGRVADPRVDAAAGAYERLGELVAVATATTDTAAAPPSATAQAARQGLASAGLLTAPDDASTAPLLLVVLPPGTAGPVDDPDSEALMGGLVTGLGQGAAGVVVVGDTASATGGLLAALRADQPGGAVSSVDGAETELGQVTAVLALIAVLNGRGGSYGESGSEGAVPLT